MLTANRLPKLVLIFCLSFSANALAAIDIKLAADYWPPFTSEKKGQRLTADLVEQALHSADFVPKTHIVAWENVLAGVKSGEYDAIIGAWKTPEREAYLKYSKPYLENRLKLIGRKDNKIKFENTRQLAFTKIGIVEGYAYGKSIMDNADIKKVTGKTLAENIKKLINKEVDYIIADSIVAQAIQEYLPEEHAKNLFIHDRPIEIKSLYFAVRKSHPKAQYILDEFNNAISSMIADGSYNEILGFSWILADTNEDGISEYITSGNVNSSLPDPAQNKYGYALFTEDSSKNNKISSKPRVQYRVDNQNFDSWRDAKNAIGDLQSVDKSNKISTTDVENRPDTYEFLLGKW